MYFKFEIKLLNLISSVVILILKLKPNPSGGRWNEEVFTFLNWVLFKQQASHRSAKELELMNCTETPNQLTM
jgi:hypothetical protein